ncbi:hypothetical protein MGI18_09335 [Bacillus sp. OVS6]|nr:hypothetical protein MGI18_09335 [Bacillus sp. OVS6]
MKSAASLGKWGIFLSLLMVIQLFLTGCGSETSSAEEEKAPSAGQKTVVHIGVQGSTGILPYAREKNRLKRLLKKQGQ